MEVKEGREAEGDTGSVYCTEVLGEAAAFVRLGCFLTTGLYVVRQHWYSNVQESLVSLQGAYLVVHVGMLP
jgi:hypothetical protein